MTFALLLHHQTAVGNTAQQIEHLSHKKHQSLYTELYLPLNYCSLGGIFTSSQISKSQFLKTFAFNHQKALFTIINLRHHIIKVPVLKTFASNHQKPDLRSSRSQIDSCVWLREPHRPLPSFLTSYRFSPILTCNFSRVPVIKEPLLLNITKTSGITM